MTALGQLEKGPYRADRFRLSPDSGRAVLGLRFSVEGHERTMAARAHST